MRRLLAALLLVVLPALPASAQITTPKPSNEPVLIKADHRISSSRPRRVALRAYLAVMGLLTD